jgi:DNA-binding NtrC family response regulator
LSTPGPNVRELENAVLRAVSLCEGDTLTVEDLGILSMPAAPSSSPGEGHAASRDSLQRQFDLSRSFGDLKRETVAAFELEYLRILMTFCDGNVSRAARKARKERRDLRRLLHKHRLDPRAFEQGV